MISGGLIVTAFGARTTLFLAGAIPALAGLVGLAWYASTLRGGAVDDPARQLTGRRRGRCGGWPACPPEASVTAAMPHSTAHTQLGEVMK